MDAPSIAPTVNVRALAVTARWQGGAVGALAGAGLGTAAGGDDGRNAIIGAVAGGAIGAYAGNKSIKCYQASTVYRR